MKNMKHLGSIIGLVAVLSLGACADMNNPNIFNSGMGYPQSSYPQTTYPQSTNAGGVYAGYGVVQSIELVKSGIGGSGMSAGTIAGAVVGGILGHQVGAGQGNTAATVLGAAGGAYAGHELEKQNQQQSDAYKFTIRMQNGSYQTVMQTAIADIRVGDRVVIENGVARRY